MPELRSFTAETLKVYMEEQKDINSFMNIDNVSAGTSSGTTKSGEQMVCPVLYVSGTAVDGGVNKEQIIALVIPPDVHGPTELLYHLLGVTLSEPRIDAVLKFIVEQLQEQNKNGKKELPWLMDQSILGGWVPIPKEW